MREAFSQQRVRQLRETVATMLERAAAAEDAGDEGPLVPKVSWLNKEKRLHGRAGDYLMPAKFEPLYIEWLADDCYDHLAQLIDGGEAHGVRHCRFQMLCAGDSQPYKQQWHRDWAGWDPEVAVGETVILLHPPPVSRCFNMDGEGSVIKMTVSPTATRRATAGRRAALGQTASTWSGTARSWQTTIS